MTVHLDCSNFGYYALHPRSKSLTPKDRKIAVALTVLMGFCTLWIGHLVCLLFFNKKTGVDSSRTAPKTDTFAQKMLTAKEKEAERLKEIASLEERLKTNKSHHVMYSIGLLYGSLDNKAKKIHWFEEAARLGHDEAHKWLDRMHELTVAVDNDYCSVIMAEKERREAQMRKWRQSQESQAKKEADGQSEIEVNETEPSKIGPFKSIDVKEGKEQVVKEPAIESQTPKEFEEKKKLVEGNARVENGIKDQEIAVSRQTAETELTKPVLNTTLTEREKEINTYKDELNEKIKVRGRESDPESIAEKTVEIGFIMAVIAMIYENDLKDISQAIEWYTKAAEEGTTGCLTDLKRLKVDITKIKDICLKKNTEVLDIRAQKSFVRVQGLDDAPKIKVEEAEPAKDVKVENGQPTIGNQTSKESEEMKPVEENAKLGKEISDHCKSLIREKSSIRVQELDDAPIKVEEVESVRVEPPNFKDAKERNARVENEIKDPEIAISRQTAETELAKPVLNTTLTESEKAINTYKDELNEKIKVRGGESDPKSIAEKTLEIGFTMGMIAIIYENFLKDISQAIEWYTKAAEEGTIGCLKELERLKVDITKIKDICLKKNTELLKIRAQKSFVRAQGLDDAPKIKVEEVEPATVEPLNFKDVKEGGGQPAIEIQTPKEFEEKRLEEENKSNGFLEEPEYTKLVPQGVLDEDFIVLRKRRKILYERLNADLRALLLRK